MTSTSDAPGPSRLTPTEWLICFVAALGFAFDIYELLMLPLIVGPALLELLGAKPGSPEFNLWVGWLFWLAAVAGWIFGLLGGSLTDLFGRRRVLVWSILLYAFSALAAGFATTAEIRPGGTHMHSSAPRSSHSICLRLCWASAYCCEPRMQ